jgi:hypothetical protein
VTNQLTALEARMLDALELCDWLLQDFHGSQHDNFRNKHLVPLIEEAARRRAADQDDNPIRI